MTSHTRATRTWILRSLLCIAPLLLVAIPAQSRAAGFFVCSDRNYTRTTNSAPTVAARWKASSMTLNRSTISFGGATTPMAQAIARARIRWNDSPMNFSIVSGSSSRPTFAAGDGTSDIAWFDDIMTLCGTGLNACAALVYNCQNGITEADVFILKTPTFSDGTATSWSFSEDKVEQVPYGGRSLHFSAMVIHELGHLLGLAHTADVFNVMGDAFRHTHVNDRRSVAYPGEDAAEGTVRLYGTRLGARADVSVSHWRRCGFDSPPNQSPTSKHCFSRMFDATTGNPVPSFALSGAPRTAASDELVFQVRRNQAVQVDFTFENNGAVSAPSVTVGFYISANDDIQGPDQRFASMPLDLTRNVPNTQLVTLRIPENGLDGKRLPAGRYFLGAWVDDTLSISESDENNTAYIPIQILD